MKLWIDGQCLQTPSRLRGIGRYVQEFIRAISEGDYGIDLSISFNAGMTDEALAARDYVQRWIDPANIHVWNGVAEAGEAYGGYSEKRRLSEVAIAHHVACLNPDVALSASPFEGGADAAVPLAPNSVLDASVAALFYDAIPHRFANKYLATPNLKSFYYRRLAFYKYFDLNLCISDFSRREARDISGSSACVNISAGISANFLDQLRDGAEPDAKVPSCPFVLYVGALDWRKNVSAVVDAFAKLPDDLRRDVRFVLAGDHPQVLLDVVKSRWNNSGLPSDNLLALGHVSDRDLVHLYRQARLLIQPSLMEGFGLTALEAMMCGTPVIGSSQGALPEIIQDPELMFDAKDPQTIADRMMRILRDPTFAARISDRGLQKAQQFSWKKSAEIAANALIETARRRQNQNKITSREALRYRTIAALGNCEVLPDFIAETLARAEPLQTAPGRFLVDATSTVRIDHGTGIQRVTKQIAGNLALQDSQRNAVVYCDSDEGFFRVNIDGEGRFSSVDRSESGKIHLSGADKILMLDSSWEFHDHHLRTLLAARLRGADVISCLYDTVPLRFEAMCHPAMPPIFAAWFKSALTYSTGFVCISRTVADELHSILEGICFPRPMKIGYWRLGADFSSMPRPALDGKRPDRRPSFLMVGTVEIRKGHRVALEAFERLWRDGINVDLVIVGKEGWGVEHLIRRLRAHPEAGQRLHWHEQASDEQLLAHYAAADALIATSYTEGFGLPLVEARHFGAPIIASDIPVFREIMNGKPFARFFEPGSSASLSSAISMFLADPTGKQALEIDETRSWISWADSARELRNLVVQGKWYRTYEPVVRKPYVSVFDNGETATKAPLDANTSRYKLELAEGPVPSEKGQNLQYVLRLTNLSNKVWSSEGLSETRYGIFLTYHVLTDKGRRLSVGDPRISISFALVPGDSHYVAIKVPTKAKKKGGTFVEVEIVQNDVTWPADPPLRLSL